MPSDGQRRYDMARLYTFPDDVRNEFVNYYSNKEIVDYFQTVPAHLIKNVCDQIRGSRTIPKRLDDLKEEDISKFPQMFKWFVCYSIE